MNKEESINIHDQPTKDIRINETLYRIVLIDSIIYIYTPKVDMFGNNYYQLLGTIREPLQSYISTDLGQGDLHHTLVYHLVAGILKAETSRDYERSE